MPKTIVRLVVLLLILSQIGDPALAACFHIQGCPSQPTPLIFSAQAVPAERGFYAKKDMNRLLTSFIFRLLKPGKKLAMGGYALAFPLIAQMDFPLPGSWQWELLWGDAKQGAALDKLTRLTSGEKIITMGYIVAAIVSILGGCVGLSLWENAWEKRVQALSDSVKYDDWEKKLYDYKFEKISSHPPDATFFVGLSGALTGLLVFGLIAAVILKSFTGFVLVTIVALAGAKLLNRMLNKTHAKSLQKIAKEWGIENLNSFVLFALFAGGISALFGNVSLSASVLNSASQIAAPVAASHGANLGVGIGGVAGALVHIISSSFPVFLVSLASFLGFRRLQNRSIPLHNLAAITSAS